MSTDSMMLAKLKHINSKLTDFYSLLQEISKEESFIVLEKPLIEIGDLLSEIIEQ